jgi:hypothetical protein
MWMQATSEEKQEGDFTNTNAECGIKIPKSAIRNPQSKAYGFQTYTGTRDDTGYGEGLHREEHQARSCPP